MSSSLPKDRIIGIVCVLFAQIFFGTTFSINKIVMEQGVSPYALGFYKVLIVTVCLFPFIHKCKGSTLWNARDWRRVFFVGGIAYTSGMVLEYYGTDLTMSSNASLIVSTEAVFATLLSVVILKEKLHKTAVIGGITAIMGMALVMLKDIRKAEFHLGPELQGDLIVFLSVIGWGLYTVFSKKILDHSNPIYTLFYVSLFSSFTLGILCVLTGNVLDFNTMTNTAWFGTLYLGIFGSCVGMVCYFQALKRLPASICALTLTLLPVFGVLFSILLRGETLTVIQGVGAIIIIGSVGYVVMPREEETPITEDTLIGM